MNLDDMIALINRHKDGLIKEDYTQESAKWSQIINTLNVQDRYIQEQKVQIKDLTIALDSTDQDVVELMGKIAKADEMLKAIDVILVRTTVMNSILLSDAADAYRNFGETEK